MFLKSVFFVALFAFSSGKKIMELNDKNFYDGVDQKKYTLVMFYAPWCGHCKHLRPELEKAKEMLSEEKPPVGFAAIDCTEDIGKETCDKYSITGYPTLKLFKFGEFHAPYKGSREASEIVKYMRAQNAPASTELKTMAEVEEFLKGKKGKLIGFFKKDNEKKTNFKKYADRNRGNILFGYTSNADVLKKYGLSDGVILFRDPILNNIFEENQVKFTGAGANLDEFKEFVEKNYYGLVGHRQPDGIAEIKPPYVVAYYDVDYVNNIKGTNYWRNRILKAVQSYTGQYRFAISNKDDYENELNEYGLEDTSSKKPIILARDKDEQKYIMKEEFSIENLQSFLKDLDEGKIEPYVKSEPIPTENNGPVKIAVAKNFIDVVINNGKDTLIEFYAPWCGHCKKLAPVLEELGEKLSNEDVDIVKFNAHDNDMPPGLEVGGYPTFFWFPRDKKAEPLYFDGARNLDGFVKYIAKHATEELKGFDRDGESKKTEL